MKPDRSVWLVGARVAVSPHIVVKASLLVQDGWIERVVYREPLTDEKNIPAVNLEGYLILPGLINSHDHLEFNLFPRLGRRFYANAQEWAHDIYHPEHCPIREHLSVPKTIRLFWGGLKNLLSGVTTVCHHNPYEPLFDHTFPVHVVKRYGWAHSLAFDADVLRAFQATPSGFPFLIHLAEGTDRASGEEIFTLDEMGALGRHTILVHGVGLTQAGHALRQRKGSALVWCPTSNRFTLGTTLEPATIGTLDRICLGSDSALTGQGDLLDEIRDVRSKTGISPDGIYRMVTDAASDILCLRNGEGRIYPGAIADLVAVPWYGASPAKTVTEMDREQVEMVCVSGKLHLASEKIANRWSPRSTDGLEWISVDATRRLVKAPVEQLVREASNHLVENVRLAGRQVCA